MSGDITIAELTSDLFPVNLIDCGITFSNPMAVRAKIESLENAIRNAPCEKIQIKTTHRFGKNLYAREVFIPKGSLIIGKIHKHECISIIGNGDLTALTENGVKRITPPFCEVSKAGLKRVGFAHEDTVWITIHSTNKKSIPEIDEELVAKDYSDVDVTDQDIITLFTQEGSL